MQTTQDVANGSHTKTDTAEHGPFVQSTTDASSPGNTNAIVNCNDALKPPSNQSPPRVLGCGSLHHSPPLRPPPIRIAELNGLSFSPKKGATGSTSNILSSSKTASISNMAADSPSSSFSEQQSPPPSVEPFIIGVTGASASGKTTVCHKIIDGLGDQRCVLVSLDWFYHGLPPDVNSASYNFDHPSAFDFEALREVLSQMKRRKPVRVPTYNFALHKRDETNCVHLNVADVIIVEGILTYYDRPTRDMMHMKIFVDEDADICLSRRIERDVASRGRSVASILSQYKRFVKPAFEEFILPTKRYADIIMPRGAENVVLIDMIIKHIALKIRQDDLRKLYPGLILMADSFQTRGLHTIIRDTNASRDDFIFYSNRLMRLLVEEGLGLLPFRRKTVETPIGSTYQGVGFVAGIAAVSLLPDGATMESSIRAVCNTVRIGKIVVTEDHKAKKTSDEIVMHVTYENLPADIAKRFVLVLAPVMNSGSSCEHAIARLVNVGCREDRIVLLSLVVAPQAVHRICSRFPNMKLVVSAVDKGLNEEGLVYPGIGDFATRYAGND